MPTKCTKLFLRYLCYNIATNSHICFGPIHQDPPQFTATLRRNASILTISIFHSTSDAYKSDQLGFVPKYFVSLTTILCGLKRVGILSAALIILSIFRNNSVHFVGLVSRKMVNGSFHKVRTLYDTLIRREPCKRTWYLTSRSGMRRHGLDWCGSGQGRLVSTCKCDNEPSGFHKMWAISWLVHQSFEQPRGLVVPGSIPGSAVGIFPCRGRFP
jgi:hypothetical protein